MKPSWLIGRVGEDAFDVDGGDGDRRGENQRDAADRGDDEQHFGREQRVDAADEEDAGRDHRGGMNERGDGRGAFHRVWQPDVERELGTFAHAAAEEPDAGDEQSPLAPVGIRIVAEVGD